MGLLFNFLHSRSEQGHASLPDDHYIYYYYYCYCYCYYCYILFIIYIYIHIYYIIHITTQLHPVHVIRFYVMIFSPRVGLPRKHFLIGNHRSGVRLSQGWVRKDEHLRTRIGCTACGGEMLRVCLKMSCTRRPM